jgi:hypothetical protein
MDDKVQLKNARNLSAFTTVELNFSYNSSNYNLRVKDSTFFNVRIKVEEIWLNLTILFISVRLLFAT